MIRMPGPGTSILGQGECDLKAAIPGRRSGLGLAVMRRSLVPVPLVVISGRLVAPAQVLLVGRSTRKHRLGRLATDLHGRR
jgi:hypothetical protein